MIISLTNSLVKEMMHLQRKKYREAYKKFVIEGARFVEEAILSKNADIEQIILSEDFEKSRMYSDIKLHILSSAYKTTIVSNEIFRKICETENPQGIAALINIPRYDALYVLENCSSDSFLVILDNVRDPGNLGTIIRTSHACGACAVILLNGCVDAYNSKVLRSTMGSIFSVPILRIEICTEEFIEKLHEHRFNILAASPKHGKPIYEYDLTGKNAFVFGNEADGISNELINLTDDSVFIPMPGGAESLNVSVAAGIILFEAVRQKYSYNSGGY